MPSDGIRRLVHRPVRRSLGEGGSFSEDGSFERRRTPQLKTQNSIPPHPRPPHCRESFYIQNISYFVSIIKTHSESVRGLGLSLVSGVLSLRAAVRKFAQAPAKNSNIFEYFQTFHTIFRIFSNVSHHFSKVFKRFRTFLLYLSCPIVTA